MGVEGRILPKGLPSGNRTGDEWLGTPANAIGADRVEAASIAVRSTHSLLDESMARRYRFRFDIAPPGRLN